MKFPNGFRCFSFTFYAKNRLCNFRLDIILSHSESFLDIPLADVKEVAETYSNTVTSMHGLGTSLPKLHLSDVKGESCDPDSTWQRLQGLVKESSAQDDGKTTAEKECSEEVWRTSCILSLLGWQKR